MFDPVAALCGGGIGLELRLKEIEHFAVARIADGMDPQLKSGLHRRLGQITVKAITATADPAVARLVGIVVQQPRPARSQRAIVVSLDRARDEHGATVPVRPPGDPLPHQRRIAQREQGVDPDRQALLVFQLLECGHRLGTHTGLVHRNIAVAGHLREALERMARDHRLRHGRHRRFDHHRRAVQEQAIRLPIRAKPHLAPDRNRAGLGDLAGIERGLVGPDGKTVQAAQHHRMIGHCCAQLLLVWIAVGPGTFVPPGTEDPFALGDGLRPFGHLCDRLRFGGNIGQVDRFQLGPQFDEMGMRIDQPGDHGRAVQVDHFGSLAAQRQRPLVAADIDDLSAADRHRCGIGVPRAFCGGRIGRRLAIERGLAPAQRIDTGVGQDQIRTAGRGLGRCLGTGGDQDDAEHACEQTRLHIHSLPGMFVVRLFEPAGGPDWRRVGLIWR